jgi:copper chaperone CopZ
MEDTMKQTKTITVPNISCNHCVSRIQRELSAIPGISQVQGDSAAKAVILEWNEPPADCKSIENLLIAIGYPPEESHPGS